MGDSLPKEHGYLNSLKNPGFSRRQGQADKQATGLYLCQKHVRIPSLKTNVFQGACLPRHGWNKPKIREAVIECMDEMMTNHEKTREDVGQD